MDIRFEEWLGHWFIILMWQPENKPALIMKANLPLDVPRRERIQNLFVELTKELG